jgi:hypothetical protein
MEKQEIVLGIVGGVILVGGVLYFSSQNGGSGYQVIGPSDAVTEAALNAQAQSNAAQDSLAAVFSNNATSAFTTYISQNDALSSSLAQTQAGVQVARIAANSQTAINTANDSAQVQIAGLQTGAAQAIGLAQSGAQVSAAQAAANAQIKSAPGNSTGGIIGSILGPIASIFGL